MGESVKDLLIIGAGPAGLMAAKTASELGLSVIVIEKAKDFKVLRRACSAQFIIDESYEGEELQVEGQKLIFKRNHFEVDYTGSLIPIKNKYYHSPKNHQIHFTKANEKAFALKFDKRKLLEDLYESCKKVGVEFRLETIAIGGKDEGEEVTLEIICRGKSEMIKGKKLMDQII